MSLWGPIRFLIRFHRANTGSLARLQSIPTPVLRGSLLNGTPVPKAIRQTTICWTFIFTAMYWHSCYFSTEESESSLKI